MAKMDVQLFEHLACVLGTHAAGEVLLLAVARACGDNSSLWNKACSLGIPWQRKNWTALSKLQMQYNSHTGVAAAAGKRGDCTPGRPSRGEQELGWW